MFLFSDKTIGTSFWYRENDYGFDYSNVKPLGNSYILAKRL